MPETRRVGRWLVGSSLVLLCAIGLFTTLRALGVLARGGAPEFGGLFRYPGWAAIHFVSGTVFAVLAPFQLWAGFRERHRSLHRGLGRVALAAAVPLALSGLVLPYWMPARPLAERLFMTLVFALFLVFLVKAFAAVRARDFARHRAWMMRAVAVGLGAMTQRLVFPVFVVSAGGIHDLAGFWTLFIGSLWTSLALNLGTTEWWLAATRQRVPRTERTAGPRVTELASQGLRLD